MQTILIIEDEKRVADLLKAGLEENGYQTMVAYDGAMGLRLFQSFSFQLVISDIILPKLDGFELCKEIRKCNEKVPILMLTALGSADDKLEGFDAGADDYMVKPFLPLELVTRVKALFRRVDAFSGQEEESKDSYEIGDIRLYPKRRAAKLKDEDFALTPLEFDFLCHMLERKEHAASRDDLLKSLWKVNSKEVDTRAVDDMVKRLRKKLKDQKSTVKIETVWGYGFRLTSGGEA